MMNDDKIKSGITGMTKITMTLGQELIIMDELREIKRRERTTTIVDETKEIKIRGVIEAITCKKNIETSMFTRGKRTESVVTMVNDTIGMMIAQILGTITKGLAETGMTLMITDDN